MPRPLTSGMQTQVEGPSFAPALFVMLTFATGPQYIWTGQTSISWNGHTWTALGSLLSLTAAEEGSTVEARGLNVVVSGFDSTLLPDYLSEFQLGLPVAIYFGCLSSGSVIADPALVWAGRTDLATIRVGADSSTVEQACEGRFLDMNIAVDRRFTHEDQQMNWPGDLGCMFIDGLQEITSFWGQFPMSSNNL